MESDPKELIAALVKAKQAFMPIEKDKVNPQFKSRYSTLDSVLASVEPALHANGLVLVQRIEIEEQGTVLVTELWHTSGQRLSSRHPIIDQSTPQKMGISMTYARRYSVCAILSVTADEDTDGNTSSSSSSTSKSKSTTTQSKDSW